MPNDDDTLYRITLWDSRHARVPQLVYRKASSQSGAELLARRALRAHGISIMASGPYDRWSLYVRNPGAKGWRQIATGEAQ